MGRSLYIALDESGRVATDDIFSVAACWYVSTDPPQSALNPVRESLQSVLTDSYDYPEKNTELKGTDFSEDGREYFFNNLKSYVHHSAGVKQDYLPWNGFCIQFNYFVVPVAQLRGILSDPGSHVEVEKRIQRFLLLEVLAPLFAGSLDLEYISTVEIYLDGETWATAKTAVTAESTIPGDSQIKYNSGADSDKIKGIQFADVVANTLRGTHTGGTYGHLLRQLGDLTLN